MNLHKKLELINEFLKAAEYKIIVQKSFVFYIRAMSNPNMETGKQFTIGSKKVTKSI